MAELTIFVEFRIVLWTYLKRKQLKEKEYPF
jgi:hypothetical protein